MLRGTVYIETEEGSEPVKFIRCVMAFDVATAEAFEQRAKQDLDPALMANGLAAQQFGGRITFGPIGEPWSR